MSSNTFVWNGFGVLEFTDEFVMPSVEHVEDMAIDMLLMLEIAPSVQENNEVILHFSHPRARPDAVGLMAILKTVNVVHESGRKLAIAAHENMLMALMATGFEGKVTLVRYDPSGSTYDFFSRRRQAFLAKTS